MGKGRSAAPDANDGIRSLGYCPVSAIVAIFPPSDPDDGDDIVGSLQLLGPPSYGERTEVLIPRPLNWIARDAALPPYLLAPRLLKNAGFFRSDGENFVPTLIFFPLIACRPMSSVVSPPEASYPSLTVVAPTVRMRSGRPI